MDDCAFEPLALNSDFACGGLGTPYVRGKTALPLVYLGCALTMGGPILPGTVAMRETALLPTVGVDFFASDGGGDGR